MSNWVPNILSIKFENSVLYLHIVWVNEIEGQKTEKDYSFINPTLEGVKLQLRAARDGLDNTTSILKKITTGPFDIEPDIIIPDPDTEALRAFVTAWNAYLNGFRKIQFGLLQADDPDVAALLKTVQILYRPIYVGIG